MEFIGVNLALLSRPPFEKVMKKAGNRLKSWRNNLILFIQRCFHGFCRTFALYLCKKIPLPLPRIPLFIFSILFFPRAKEGERQ